MVVVIASQVYRALIHLGCDWRVISSYKVGPVASPCKPERFFLFFYPLPLRTQGSKCRSEGFYRPCLPWSFLVVGLTLKPWARWWWEIAQYFDVVALSELVGREAVCHCLLPPPPSVMFDSDRRFLTIAEGPDLLSKPGRRSTCPRTPRSKVLGSVVFVLMWPTSTLFLKNPPCSSVRWPPRCARSLQPQPQPQIYCRWKPNAPTPPNKAPFLSASTSCPSLKDKLSAASASPSGLLVNGGGGVTPFTALLERVPEVVDSACSTPPLASPTFAVGGAAAARRAGGGVTGDSKQQPLEQRGDCDRGDGSPSELCGGGGGGGDREDATAIAAPAAVGGDGDEDDDAMDGNENQDPRAAANKAASHGRAVAEDGVVAAPTTTVRAKSPRTRQAAAAAAAERQCQARPPPRHGAAAGARCEEGRGGNRGDEDVDGDVSMPSGPAVLSLTPAFSPGGDRTNGSNTAKGVAAGGGWKDASPTDAPAATSAPSSASGDGRRNGGPGRSGLRAGGGGSALAGGARATEKSSGGGGVIVTAAAASAPGSLGGATSNPFLKPDFVIKVCLTLYKVRRQTVAAGRTDIGVRVFVCFSYLFFVWAE